MAIVYFGTFDPFHENHFRLVDYVARKYQPKKIVLIPNSDLPSSGSRPTLGTGTGFKSGALPLAHRLETVQTRFRNLSHDEEHLRRIVDVISPGQTKTNWQGRQKLACQYGKEHHLPILYVVLGLDSLTSSLTRTEDGGAGYHNPLDKFILKILAIPRLGYHIPDVPPKYQGKVTIDRDYHEKHQISSTLVRQLIRGRLPVDQHLCHPKIVEYLAKEGCYVSTQLVIPEFKLECNEKEREVFLNLGPVTVLMGSPGSGKTTLAESLATKMGSQFISTGDLYRLEMEGDTGTYRILQRYKHNPLDFRQALGLFIIYKLQQLVLAYYHGTDDQDHQDHIKKGIVLEGFKASDLTHWTEHIGPIDQVIYVQVEREKLGARVALRNLSRKEDRKSVV